MKKEFRPIKQKYYMQEFDRDDQLALSVQTYFRRSRKRMYAYLISTLFFVGLMVFSIALQQDYLEINLNGNSNGQFTLNQQLNPPIEIQLISSDSYLLLDVELYLDGEYIEHQTINKILYMNSTHTITSNKSFPFTVRLMQQFTFVPQSYLIIQIIMFVISFLYLILELLQKKNF